VSDGISRRHGLGLCSSSYQITDAGREAARAEARRLAALVDAARQRGLLC